MSKWIPVIVNTISLADPAGVSGAGFLSSCRLCLSLNTMPDGPDPFFTGDSIFSGTSRLLARLDRILHQLPTSLSEILRPFF